MRRPLQLLLLTPLAILPLAAQATFNFSTPVTIGPTEAPGVWYPDRFPPHGFFSPATAPGTANALDESIAAADEQPYVTDPVAPGWHNTQGRQFDFITHPAAVQIDLYVPSDWATQDERKAGFWLSMFDSSNAYTGDNPIIEFQGPITTDLMGAGYHPNGGFAGFYGWNNHTNAFDFIGFPPGFAYNTWVRLTISWDGTQFTYTVTSPFGSTQINSPTGSATDSYIHNVILEGYNYGQDYNIFWAGSPNPGFSGFLTASWWYWYVL